MAEDVGWRNFYWLSTAVNAVALLVAIFMFPETRYKRQVPQKLSSKSSKKDMEPANIDEKSTINHNELSEVATLPPTEAEVGAHGAYLGKGKPAQWQWKLFQPNPNAVREILMEVWIPFQLHLFPITQFAGFVVSWSCSTFFILNMTQSQAFAAPPYNRSQRWIGSYFPLLLWVISNVF